MPFFSPIFRDSSRLGCRAKLRIMATSSKEVKKTEKKKNGGRNVFQRGKREGSSESWQTLLAQMLMPTDANPTAISRFGTMWMSILCITCVEWDGLQFCNLSSILFLAAFDHESPEQCSLYILYSRLMFQLKTWTLNESSIISNCIQMF